MDNQLLTLSKIFTERLFRIPDYQRGYAWGAKQLKEFWTDLENLDLDSNHYTGVLTLEEVPGEKAEKWDEDFWIIDAKSFAAFYVVDGQQRLTTLIVLIQTILEAIDESDEINYTSRADIRRKFIFDSKDNQISRSYIFGYEKDNPSYEHLKTKIFGEASMTSAFEETAYTNNLDRAKIFFWEKVASMSMEEIQILYRKITQQLLFNIFTIGEEIDVCVAFETMNNRGKPLSKLELLKNRLIYLSLLFDSESYEKEKLRRSINDCWKALYHNLGRNKENVLDDDEFLRTHYFVYFGEDLFYVSEDERLFPRRALNPSVIIEDLLEHRFSPQKVNYRPDDTKIDLSDVYDYANSLQESILIWYAMHNPFESKYDDDVRIWLDKLNRIGIHPYKPIVLSFLSQTDDQKKILEFLKVLERRCFVLYFMFDYPVHFSGMIPEAIEAAVNLREGSITLQQTIKKFDESTNRFLDEIELKKVFNSKMRNKGFYKWTGIRYFLYEYNLHLQASSKTSRTKIFWPEYNEEMEDFISVEHIYPQNARARYWTDRFKSLSQPQKKLVRDSLGNLLPLSKPKNSSLSNREFPDKVKCPNHESVGYQFGCYAENEVAIEDEWTPNAILSRGIKMLEFMEQRWDLKLGGKQVKKDILGLTFLD